MKLLKYPLSDGQKYTFQTLSILEQLGIKKAQRKIEELQEEKDKIIFEFDNNGKIKKDSKDNLIPKTLSNKDKDRIDEIDLEILDINLDIVRKSICKHHSAFKINPDKAEDRKIKDNLMDLMDTPDLRTIAEFVTSGIYIPKESVFEAVSEIDLNEEAKSDE